MGKIVKRELFVFFVLFLLLALSMHYKEWISHPVQHIENLPQSPFGPLHPLLFTLFFYILVLVVRVAIHWARKFQRRRKL
ncbi:MAG: hypothetical protein C6I05_07785 [Epsilonproteobacteria bacterium]|nr:hypothetical protein [Campylobacterota bacterium]